MNPDTSEKQSDVDSKFEDYSELRDQALREAAEDQQNNPSEVADVPGLELPHTVAMTELSAPEQPAEVLSPDVQLEARRVLVHASDTLFLQLGKLERLPSESKVSALGDLWRNFEQNIDSNVFASEVGDQLLLALLGHTRELTQDPPQITNPDVQNALMFLDAAEAAYARDFVAAREFLEGISDSPKLQEVLQDRLQAAKTEPYDGLQIGAETSAEHLHLLTGGAEPIIAPEQLEAAHIGITVGTTVETLQAMVASPHGRYLTAHEHATTGGADRGESRVRISRYNQKRRDFEAAFGHNPNVFVPRPVYGALTSELESNRASSFGAVTLYPKAELTDSPKVAYFYGDSLEKNNTAAMMQQRVDSNDAKTAYAHLVSLWQHHVRTPYALVEAQLPGLRLDDLEQVGIFCRKGDGARVDALAGELIDRGIKVEEEFEWRFSGDIARRREKGLSENEAVSELITILRGKFEDTPYLSIAILLLADTDLPEQDKADLALLEDAGVIIKRPIVNRRRKDYILAR